MSDAAHKTLRGVSVALRLAMAATFAGVGVSTAQSKKPPMTTMDSAGGAPQAPSMRVMMGVPLPFGIMIGRAERWMVGYQYMFDRLDGLLTGSTGVSESDVLLQFPTTPTDMTMQTHMGMVMYAPTARFTLMASVPYVTMSMGELHRDETRSTEHSEGFGDLEMLGLYSLYATPHLRHRILADFGLGLPTGSVNQLDAEGVRAEYPMQTGSGTLSLLPGFTYLGQTLPWSWGAQVSATVRLGINEQGYRLGDRYETRMWVVRQLATWVSISTEATGEWLANIHGSDPQLDPTDEPTKDPNLQGGRRFNASLGVTVHPPGGVLKGQQFHLQGEVPVMQSLDGPQLERSFMLHAAWQWEF